MPPYDTIKRSTLQAAIEAGISTLQAVAPEQREELIVRLRIIGAEASRIVWGAFGHPRASDALDLDCEGCPLTKAGVLAVAPRGASWALGYTEGFWADFDNYMRAAGCLYPGVPADIVEG